MKSARTTAAFTLVELLVVLSIMGILAMMVVPALKNFGKAEAAASAMRQMMDDVHRARQLAISQRTTVYMIFLPANFWNDSSYVGNLAAYNNLPPAEKDKASKLFDKQLNSYTFVTVRSAGDQPGRNVARYLSQWRSLPEGTFIAPWKFAPPTGNNEPVIARTIADPPPPATPDRVFHVKGFNLTTAEDRIPFPSPEGSIAFRLPYIAFDHLGSVIGAVNSGSSTRERYPREDEYIPLARGSLGVALDANKVTLQKPPSVSEKPEGNSTNAFTLVHVEWLTGRARVERQEVR